MCDGNEQRSGGEYNRVAIAFVGLIILILLGVGGVGCDADRAEAVRAYNEGMRAFEMGSTSEAVGLMELALEEDPSFTDAAYTLGQIYQTRLGNPDEAAHNFRRAVDAEPDNPRFNYRLGSALAEGGNYRQAMRFLNNAVDLDPNYSRAWYELGRSQAAEGQFLDAIDSLESSIETNPRLRLAEDDVGGEHYHALADLYMRFRLYDHAVRVYENGVRNNPDATRLHHGLGISLMQLGRHADAVDSFEIVLEHNERHGSANFNIAVAYYESGDLEAAIEQLEHLVEAGGAGMTEARRRAAAALLDDLQEEEEEEEDEG